MTSKAEKLLESMRQSKAGWKTADLERLYKGYGFVISHGTNHDIVKHPEFPILRTTLPRHNYLAKPYVTEAVKLIDRLLELRKEAENENQSEETS